MLRTPLDPITIGLTFSLPLILFLGVAWFIRQRAWAFPEWLPRSVSGRYAPLAAGLLSGIATLIVWGSLREPGVIHDEQAYLLQAEILSRFRWTGEPPPLPEFFEQTHVFVEPRLAAKYPPGHALVLVPGIWLGLPGIMPIALTAVAGGLIFTIARRVLNGPAGLLVWALWCAAGESLFWRASYLSQNTSTALWLFSLWALLKWRDHHRRVHLVLVSTALAWLYLTRPLTALPLAIPVVAYVLAQARFLGLWRQLVVASAFAVPVLALNLVWQERTLGDWRTSPYAEYSRQYFPFVKPGFGVDATPPLRTVPPEIAWVADGFRHLHEAHQLTALPRIFADRVLALFVTLAKDQVWLVPLFIWGVVRARGPVLFALLSALLQVTAYLIYAHPAFWVAYYAEIFPVFFLVAMVGLSTMGQAQGKLDSTQLQTAMIVMLVCLTPWLARDIRNAREERGDFSVFHRSAAAILSSILDARAVVFVRYPAGHQHHDSLIMNNVDYRTAKLWLVYDRGTQNERLLRMTDRAAYRLSTETWSLERLR